MWHQERVFLLLSLPDPFLSTRVDSVLETRSEVPVSRWELPRELYAGSRRRKWSCAHKVAAECPAGTEWPGPERGAGRGQMLPGCGGQSARVGGRATGKTIALTRRTFAGIVMSLLLNMLSRLVITFLPRSKCLLISWLQSPSAVILEPQKINSDTVST